MKIIVVGAGIVGCAIAHELVSRGAAVHLVDMRGIGQGATQASAGMLAPYVEGHIDALLQLGVRSLSMYDDFVARVSRDSGAPVEYERSGTLHLARNENEEVELQTATQRFAAAHVAHTLMSGDEARRLEPALSPRIRTAMLLPAHGYVRAAELTAALATAVVRGGAIVSTATVERIEQEQAGVSLATSGGRVEGDAVVVAAGSWSGALLRTPATAPLVRPVRGQLIHLRFPSRPLSCVVWGTGCYMVSWRDGSLLVGATVEEAGFDEGATASGVTHLLTSSAELLATMPEARFDGVRVGLRPGTPDELPLIGPSSTMRGVYYATGHYRNGVLLSPLTARIVADLVLEGRRAAELELVRPDRFGL